MTTINSFSRRNGFSTARSQVALTDAEIRHYAPSIFAEQKHASRSEKYGYVSTASILAELRQHGFEPMMVSQGGSKDAAKTGFTKHLIRLRSGGSKVIVGNVFPEISILNSHDGTSSFQLDIGLFRGICSNGLIAAVGQMSTVRVPHTLKAAELILENSTRIVEMVPVIGTNVIEMQKTLLTEEIRRELATAALKLRWDAGTAPISVDDVLAPRRIEDKNEDLWSVYNVIQENLIRGGIKYVQTAKTNGKKSNVATKDVRGLTADLNINRGLWDLATATYSVVHGNGTEIVLPA